MADTAAYSAADGSVSEAVKLASSAGTVRDGESSAVAHGDVLEAE